MSTECADGVCRRSVPTQCADRVCPARFWNGVMTKASKIKMPLFAEVLHTSGGVRTRGSTKQDAEGGGRARHALPQQGQTAKKNVMTPHKLGDELAWNHTWQCSDRGARRLRTQLARRSFARPFTAARGKRENQIDGPLQGERARPAARGVRPPYLFFPR